MARTWRDGTSTTPFKKLDPTKKINYRGITLLAALGKRFTYILVGSFIWALDVTFREHQYAFRPHRGRILSLGKSNMIVWCATLPPPPDFVAAENDVVLTAFPCGSF